MAIHNEEEFKIDQNKKKYTISISIQEDQLYLGLTLLSNPPKKYSSYFSLNELRISSKIFDHTKTLFEAKEIIKRTVIKKQLLINEDEHRARITFDTGVGHDSVPFPIILFRDSNYTQANNLNSEDPKDNIKRSKQNKNNNKNNGNNNTNKKSNLNGQSEEKSLNGSSSNNTTNNIPYLRASIGNNINNKMLNHNTNINNNSNNKNTPINQNNAENVQFNNSMKRINVNNKKNNNLGNQNVNNNDNNKKNVNENKLYEKVDFVNNVNNNINKANIANGNATKDYIAINNNLLHIIYNNMNNANNINSSFYRNLQYSFGQDNNYDNVTVHTVNTINTVNTNIPITRQNLRNIDNNSIDQVYAKQNLNIQKNGILKNVNINNNIKNNPMYINNNINNGKLNINNLKNQNNLHRKIPPNYENVLIDPAIIAQNQSFNTSPIQRNLTKIPNIDTNDFIMNKTFENNDNVNNKDNENEKKNDNNNDNDNNDKNSISSSSSDEGENIDNIDDNIEELNSANRPYRFKNLAIHGSKKIKGNLEKFKENQNMGDYVPAGSKFVSYLKFPDTKINSNLSMTASTISSSLTSGSNRIVGIEKNIIKNPYELEEITSRIQRILNKRNIKYKLLYKASVDGDTATAFHNKCDKIPNTLVLIKASGDKRFGGFTTQTWDGDDINKEDDKCFIFSIDNMKIYDIIEGEEAINCNPDLGPIFIDQIKLLDKFFIQGGSTNKKGITFNTKGDFEINGGAEKFGVREVEVYHAK